MDHQASNASVEAKTCSTGSDNPFMALVDAATSIFESKQETKNESPNQDLLAGSDNDENTIANSRGEYKTESSASAISKSTSRDETVLSNKKTNMKTKRSSTKLTFSEQLMRVLDNEDKKKDGTLAWMPDGRSFTVVHQKKFCASTMQEMFKIRNMSSFVRKLTRWGFARVHDTRTNNSDIFKHPYFQRGEPELCKMRVRCVGSTLSAATVAVAADLSSTKPSSLSSHQAVACSQLASTEQAKQHQHQQAQQHGHYMLNNVNNITPTTNKTSVSINSNGQNLPSSNKRSLFHVPSPRLVTMKRTSSHTLEAVAVVSPSQTPTRATPAMPLPSPALSAQSSHLPYRSDQLASRVMASALETLRRDTKVPSTSSNTVSTNSLLSSTFMPQSLQQSVQQRAALRGSIIQQHQQRMSADALRHQQLEEESKRISQRIEQNSIMIARAKAVLAATKNQSRALLASDTNVSPSPSLRHLNTNLDNSNNSSMPSPTIATSPLHHNGTNNAVATSSEAISSASSFYAAHLR